MSESNILEEQFTNGRKLLISATTPNGHIQLNASVTSLGGRHFKVRAEHPIPTTLFIPQQQLKIRLLGGSRSTLPLQCRFLRVDEKKPREMVLSIPDGEWITNRRAFVRATMKIPVRITRFSGQVFTGHTIDISGGGALLHLDDKLANSERITIVLGPLESSNNETLELEAKVARFVEITPNRKRPKEVFSATAIRFTKAPTRAQNKICKLVIVSQFEQRRAELREFLAKE